MATVTTKTAEPLGKCLCVVWTGHKQGLLQLVLQNLSEVLYPYRIEDTTCQNCKQTRSSCLVKLRHIDSKRPCISYCLKPSLSLQGEQGDVSSPTPPTHLLDQAGPCLGQQPESQPPGNQADTKPQGTVPIKGARLLEGENASSVGMLRQKALLPSPVHPQSLYLYSLYKGVWESFRQKL